MKRYLQNKQVLDEREMQEMYRIEHSGFWLMYGLLCASVLVQLLGGAPMRQMAGELAVLIVTSVVMVIANVRHGIWDTNSRPSLRGNALYAAGSGLCVAVLLFVVSGNIAAALAAGVCAGLLCFAALSLLMHYMRRRQEKRDAELDNE